MRVPSAFLVFVLGASLFGQDKPTPLSAGQRAVGKILPEVTGTDVDGKPLKLSDYRGKVTVLYFWGTWCPPCRAMIPHEKEMAKKFKDKPFALLGVSSDANVGTLKKFLAAEEMTWKHFNDGGRSGPIHQQFGVRYWPNIYVLDAKGVIRHKDIRGKELEDAVEELLKEVK
jgi:peroxiredoxin